jgi:hypothetical protein
MTVPKFAIKDIKANPFRHIDRYPIRQDKVAALRESIRTTSFWDNIVARRRNGQAEIAYGHHRLIALTEEYGPNHEVDLIVRDLPDEAMLQIMARENMEEWGTSAAVEHETVRAVVEAYADGRIELPHVSRDANVRHLRHAPSFIAGEPPRADGARPYTARTVAQFLGWVQPSGEPQDKVENALAALQFIEDGLLSEADFEGLTTKQAGAVIEQARRAAAQREAAARLHAQQAEQAARDAAAAERRREQIELEQRRQRESAQQARDELERRSAKDEEARLAAARRGAEEERRTAEWRRAAEERREREERERGRRQATKVGKEVSRELQAGRIGYREAPMVAARVTEKRIGPPPLMNDFARRLATDLNAVLDPDRDQRVKRIEVMIEYRSDLSPVLRNDLARTLGQLADRARGYEQRLVGGPEQPTPELTTEAHR